MTTIFYIIILLLSINELYFMYNRKRLQRNFHERDIESVRLLDLVYYFLKSTSFVWSLLGLFTFIWPLFLVLISIWVMKFVLYHISERSYTIYSLVVPFMNLLIYSTIIYIKFIG